MLKDIKKIYKEVIWIVVLAGLFGIFNNILADKSLPLIPREDPDSFIDDSVLFDNKMADNKILLEKTVSYQQIVKLVNKQDVLFIDARSPEQYAEGHIGNAINIFPQNENQEEFLTLVNSLPENKIFIIYCDGGACDLSHELAKVMLEFGFTQAFLYKGGWEEWIEKQGIQ
jgi:rhodanese-related sulfurtransferase